MQELKYVAERHVVEFKEFMILKNFSKRTISGILRLQIIHHFRPIRIIIQ